MEDLTTRSLQPELIDSESLDFIQSRTFLRELELINKLVLTYPPTLCAIKKILQAKHIGKKRPLKILDVGSGYGDMLRKISGWADKKGISVELTGADINPWAVKAAQEATPESMKITYLTRDIFKEDFQNRYDIIISSLFTHHLDNQSLIKFIKWMSDHANCGWFINDLHRHRVPYYFIKYFVRLLQLDRLIINDAPLSVARSFVRADWTRLIEEAKIMGGKISISWHWPFRYCVLCLK